ncbi:MAG: AAA-like domain-containing protein [Polyangiales bacterium]
MTHHPPSWLSKRGLETLQAWIARGDRFDAHLFGHMHTPETRLVVEQGDARPVTVQAPSLFGVEPLPGGTVSREVGYTLLRFDMERRAWRLTPRAATKVGAGLQMNPDTRFKLRESSWIEFTSHRERPTSVEPAQVEDATTNALPELPGGPYNERLYVARAEVENKALRMLASVGRPTVLCGSRGMGKTWMLSHLLGRWRKEHPDARIVNVPFGEFDTEALTSLDSFVWRFAGVVADQLGIAGELVDRLDPKRSQRLTGMMRLRKFFEEAALKPADPIVLALDDADRLREHNFRQDFYAGLRAWMDHASNTPLARLRLLIAIAVPAAKLIEGNGSRSIFNLTVPLDLTPFNAEQTLEVAKRCGLSPDPGKVQNILARTHGSPGEIVRELCDQRSL